MNSVFKYLIKRRFFFLLSAICPLLLSACAEENKTKLIVLVHSDLSVGGGLDLNGEQRLGGVRVRVTREGGPEDNEPTNFELNEQGELPISFVVVPKEGDITSKLTLEFEAVTKIDAGGVSLFAHQVDTYFLKDQQRLLPVFLSRRCVALRATCADGETCNERGCQPREINANTLDSVVEGKESDHTWPNTPPAPPEVIIEPNSAKTSDDLECVVISTKSNFQGDALAFAYMWTKDGDDTENTSARLSASQTSRGETWRCKVQAIDSTRAMNAQKSDFGVAELTIENTLPSVDSVMITPSQGNESTTFSCVHSGLRDEDENDVPEAKIEWFVNDMKQTITSTTLDGTNFDRSDTIKCTVTPFQVQGQLQGTPVESALITIGNTPPSCDYVTVGPLSGTVTDTYTCQPTCSDLDGDSVNISYSWSNGMMPLASITSTISGPELSKGDDLTCTVTPNDGMVDGESRPSLNSVRIENSPPSAGTVELSTPAYTAQDIVANISGFEDLDGDVLTYNVKFGVVHSLSSTSTVYNLQPQTSTVAILSPQMAVFRRDDIVYVEVTATDGTSTTATAAVQLVVRNTPPSFLNASINPPSGTTLTTFSCQGMGWHDDDGDLNIPENHSYKWYVTTGTVVSAPHFGQTLTSSHFQRGDEIFCKVGPYDGEVQGYGWWTGPSRTVTIASIPPNPPAVSFDPPTPTETDDVRCIATTIDPDLEGDSVSYNYSWTNGTSTTGDQILENWRTTKGETWRCTATPHDGFVSGPSGEASVEIRAGPVLRYDMTSFVSNVILNSGTLGAGSPPNYDHEARLAGLGTGSTAYEYVLKNGRDALCILNPYLGSRSIHAYTPEKIPGPASGQPINKITMNAWVYFESNNLSGSAKTISKLDAGLQGGKVSLTILPDGRIQSTIENAAGSILEVSSTATVAAAPKWQHVALVIDNKTIYFYLNGAEVYRGLRSIPGNLFDRDPAFEFAGDIPDSSANFPGCLSDVEVWTRALRADEICQHVGGNTCVDWKRSHRLALDFSTSEATTQQFKACVNSGACTLGPFQNTQNYNYNSAPVGGCNLGRDYRDGHPMNCVTWRAADEFCTWSRGRLPTDDEWTYEASNGLQQDYPWGDAQADCNYCIMDDPFFNFSGCGNNRTEEVCSKSLGNSVSGICDMAGNVQEWTATEDPNSISNFYMRGGDFQSDDPADLMANARTSKSHTQAQSKDGIRCVRDPERPLSDLTAYWRLDGHAQDAFGNHHGTLLGTWSTQDLRGLASRPTAPQLSTYFQAMTFGNGRSVEIPHSSALDNFDAFTICAWIWPQTSISDPNNDSPRWIVFKGNGGEVNNSYGLFITPENRFNFVLAQNSGASLQVTAPLSSDPSIDVWIHVCGRYDGRSASIYRNGLEVESMSNAGPTQLSVQGTFSLLSIGNCSGTCTVENTQNTTGTAFDGQIDEVKLWRHALSPSRICAEAESSSCLEWKRSEAAQLEFTKSEITYHQFNQCVEANACTDGSNSADWDVNTNNPACTYDSLSRAAAMNCVNWYAASQFCAWAGGRLPTPDEWRAEANQDSTRTYPWGNTPAPNCELAVMHSGVTVGCGSSSGWSEAVCSRKLGNSASGLCDMAGNVSEWTYTSTTAVQNSQIVLGGNYHTRTSARLNGTSWDQERPDEKYPHTGFRCVRDLRP